jgi:ferric-dicitrate binding protein FerR (iron transport regulator)
MKTEQWFARELESWAQQPSELSAEEAAAAVTARLRPRAAPRRRPAARRVLLAAAATAALVLAGTAVLLRDRPDRRPASGTPATIVLSSGTLLVIDLGEVRR